MPSKIFSIRRAKFLTTFFISCQISGQFASWIPPPVRHHASVTTFFSSFFAIYLLFLHKLAPWMPPGWVPGAVAPSALPLCTPLHDSVRELWVFMGSHQGFHLLLPS